MGEAIRLLPLFLTLCLNCEKSPLPDGKFAVGQRWFHHCLMAK